MTSKENKTNFTY